MYCSVSGGGWRKCHWCWADGNGSPVLHSRVWSTGRNYNIYTRKKGKPLRIMVLPPTEANLLLHMKRVGFHHLRLTPVPLFLAFWLILSVVVAKLQARLVALVVAAAVRDIICHVLSTVRVQLAICVVIHWHWGTMQLLVFERARHRHAYWFWRRPWRDATGVGMNL